jgi:Zn-dependent peptidase ImmA (M78 family)
VEDLPALEPALDAIACFGDRSGPAVLVNPNGRHAHSAGGRRATLAHEIAHLLLDRGRGLLAAEVFGGSTPVRLERRARAFAAELLLPREVASRALAHASSLKHASGELEERYGVSRQVVGWQLKNGPGWELLGADDQERVRRWVRKP